MMLFRKTAAGVFVAHSAVITGDVRIGAESSVWFGVVIRGDVAAVRIGSRVNIQDNAVVHCDYEKPNVIEDDVVVGHGAILHGELVGRGSLIGIGARLLGGSRIGAGCVVAAGAVVPPGLDVPDGMMVMGVPGKIVRPVRDEERAYIAAVRDRYVELAGKYVRGEWGLADL